MQNKVPNIGIALKICSYKFHAFSEKEAYLQGCKKLANVMASKKYQNITTKIINLGENTFEFVVYTMLDITEEQSHFCKMCKEMHCSFYINEEYNCSRCNYKTFLKRMREKLMISRSYYREQFLVGTLNSLYDQMARDKNAEAAGEGAAAPAEEEADEGWSLGAILSEAGGTIVDNLVDLGGAFTDPLGIAVDDLSDTAAAAESQEVTVTTIDMMQKLFGSQLAAFAYLMLVLLYMPCVAAIAAVYREAGAAWTLFLAAWTTVLGYSTATIVYRVGTFAQDPLYATVAIVISLGLLASLLFFMRNYVKNNRGKGPKVIPIAVAQPS